MGTTTPTFHGQAGTRRWHVELGDQDSKWIIDVKLNEASDVQFVREANPFPKFSGQESLTVRFLGPSARPTLYCYTDKLYDEEGRLFPNKLYAWTSPRDKYSRDPDLQNTRATLPGAASLT